MCGTMWCAKDVPDEYLIPVDLCPKCYEKIGKQYTEEQQMKADLVAKGSDLMPYGKCFISGKDLFDEVNPISEYDDYVAVKDNTISFCHCGKAVVTVSKNLLKRIYQKVIEEEAREAVGKE